MLKDFEKRYLVYFTKLQRLQWANYFEKKDYDLSAIDKEVYKLVCSYSGKIQKSDRKSRIAELIIKRELVDKKPDISKLRNYIDNLENYALDIDDEIKRDNFKYKLEMAKRMKRDVLKLMEMRNSSAIDIGYSSYADLVFDTEEINREKLIVLLNKYLNKNLEKAKTLIKKYDFSFENWFEDLNRILQKNYSSAKLVDNILKVMGFNKLIKSLAITYIQDGFSGYAAELAENDIRIAVTPVKSLNGLRILFHELGHAILYKLNKEKGLFRILPAALNESMAVVFEYLASAILLNSEERKIINELIILEYTRCAISALYEFDLWDDPKNAEFLYEKHYGKLGLKILDSGIWAYDSFRSIDPVYIHNYVIGAVIGENILEYLTGLYFNDYKAWGKWLYDSIYHDGRRRTLCDKIPVELW